MAPKPLSRASRFQGFSLLEMMVAISILSLALGSLYQAASGATRNVRVDERYAYAVELARSLVAENLIVPAQGKKAQGETPGGFSWRIETRLRNYPRTALARAQLYDIEVSVGWTDSSKRRQVVLNSVVEGVSN